MLSRHENLQRVNDAGNVSKNRQQDVDQEIRTASTLEEDTKRWQDDGKNDLEDVAVMKILVSVRI